MKKEKRLLDQEEEERQMQKTKMNANSRRILERKQQRVNESGVIDGVGSLVNGKRTSGLDKEGGAGESVSPDPRARRNNENVNV